MNSNRFRCFILTQALLLPLSARLLAAQLSFPRAVELAIQHSTSINIDSDSEKTYLTCVQDADFGLLNTAASSPDSLAFSTLLIDREIQEYFDKSARNSLRTIVEERRQNPESSREEQRIRALFCTTVTFAALEKVRAQIEVVRRQQLAVVRLFDIEAKRVVAG